MQRRPLPPDVLILIRIAASDPNTIDEMSSLTGRKPEILRKVAVLYVQQVMWGAGADHYRTLGVQRSASREQIAEHLRWLTKWIHPDREHLPQEAAFRDRVFSAWNALKTPDRRQEYDQSLAMRPALPKTRGEQSRSLRRLPWIEERGSRRAANVAWMGWRVLGALAIAAALVAWVMTADWWAPVAARISPHETTLSGAAEAGVAEKPVFEQNLSSEGKRVVDKVAGQSE